MAVVRHIGDLHFGHKSIVEFSSYARGGVKTVEEHDEWIIEQFNSVVNKRDLAFIHGDVAFSKEGLAKVAKLNGTKHLIFGNHDKFPLNLYLKYFHKVHGFMKYKGFWLSHPPIHPTELRGLGNIHGHTHHKLMPEKGYISVCVEQCEGKPIRFEEIRERYIANKE